MDTYIQNRYDGGLPIPISEKDFEEVRQARVVLSAALALEQCYDLMLVNYIELEKELFTNTVLQTTCDTMATNAKTYEEFYRLSSVFNRRVANFLTTARNYREQVPKHLKICTENPDTVTGSVSPFSKDYNDHPPVYLLIDELRNYVQHHSPAVHQIQTGICKKWADSGGPSEREVSVTISLTKTVFLEYLLDRRTKKKAPLNNIEGFPDSESINLMDLIREYLQYRGKLHEYARKITTEKTEKARAYSATHFPLPGRKSWKYHWSVCFQRQRYRQT